MVTKKKKNPNTLKLKEESSAATCLRKARASIVAGKKYIDIYLITVC
jgi:hypothetical protein